MLDPDAIEHNIVSSLAIRSPSITDRYRQWDG